MEKTEKRFHSNSNQKTAKMATPAVDKNKTESKMLQETKKEIIY